MRNFSVDDVGMTENRQNQWLRECVIIEKEDEINKIFIEYKKQLIENKFLVVAGMIFKID